jgi:hypothetical protein
VRSQRNRSGCDRTPRLPGGALSSFVGREIAGALAPRAPWSDRVLHVDQDHRRRHDDPPVVQDPLGRRDHASELHSAFCASRCELAELRARAAGGGRRRSIDTPRLQRGRARRIVQAPAPYPPARAFSSGRHPPPVPAALVSIPGWAGQVASGRDVPLAGSPLVTSGIAGCNTVPYTVNIALRSRGTELSMLVRVTYVCKRQTMVVQTSLAGGEG